MAVGDVKSIQTRSMLTIDGLSVKSDSILGHKGPCTYVVQISADEHSSACLHYVVE
jgi:hypothetical protein